MLLNDWNAEMERELDEAQETQNHKRELELQRELAYRSTLEEDEWVNIFFDSIEKSIHPTPSELLKRAY